MLVPLLQSVKLSFPVLKSAECSLYHDNQSDSLLMQVLDHYWLELADEAFLHELQNGDVLADLPPLKVSLNRHTGLF